VAGGACVVATAGICAGVTPGVAAAVGSSAPIVSQVANLGAGDGPCAGQLAYDYATQADKLDHIFAAKHGFEQLVQQFGSREAVIDQILQNISGLTPSSGVFQLLGSPEQVELASQLARRFAEERRAECDPLLDSLRRSLRKELLLVKVPDKRVVLRIDREALEPPKTNGGRCLMGVLGRARRDECPAGAFA
jgi:hypothetical protein